MGDCYSLGIVQRQVYRVGVPAKVVACFKKTQFCVAAQGMGCTQARYARTNNGDLHRVAPIQCGWKDLEIEKTADITWTTQNINLTVIL